MSQRVKLQINEELMEHLLKIGIVSMFPTYASICKILILSHFVETDISRFTEKPFYPSKPDLISIQLSLNTNIERSLKRQKEKSYLLMPFKNYLEMLIFLALKKIKLGVIEDEKKGE